MRHANEPLFAVPYSPSGLSPSDSYGLPVVPNLSGETLDAMREEVSSYESWQPVYRVRNAVAESPTLPGWE